MVDGENWKIHRNLAKPIFSVESRKDMFDVYHKCGSLLVNILNEHHHNHQSVEIQQLFKRFTLDTFGQIGFGTKFNCLSNPIPFSSTFDNVLIEVELNYQIPLRKMFTLSSWKKKIQLLDDFLYKIIEDRKMEGTDGKSDFLSVLIQMSKVESTGNMTDKFIRDQLMNFIIAGRDTTAVLLTWTCYFLSKHPDVEKRLREEIVAVVGLEKPTMIHTKQLKFLQMVLDESMRLCPPAAPFNTKMATRDVVLPNGAKIMKGNQVTYSPWIVHRLKEYWGDNAEEFCPTRWENPDLIKHPYQFVPFQKGPRICLGMNMAYEEAKCCIVMMFQNGIRFKLCPNQTMQYHVFAILSARKGVLMDVEKV